MRRHGLPEVDTVTPKTDPFETSVQMARWAALGQGDALSEGLLDALAGLGPDALVAALTRGQVGQLVRQTLALQLGEQSLDPDITAVVERLRPIRVTSREFLEAYGALADDLARAGVAVLLLKGAVLADALYGGVDRRPQYDIDLLVRARDARRARSILESAGYRKLRGDSHSISFVRGAVHVDLHHALRSSPAYAINEDRLWSRAQSVTVAGQDVRTLAHDDTLAFLAMSLTEDVGFGMQKLKNLCDIWLLARFLDATVDWDQWFTTRADEHTDAMAANGCAIALDVLEAGPDTPHLSRALAQRPGLVRVTDRAQAVTLMSAPRGDPDNMAWFSAVYPGSMLRFRIRSLITGWPETRHEITPRRLAFELKVLRTRRRERATTPGP
jgi:hypothetical protein